MQFGGQPTLWSETEIEGLRLRSVSQILIEEIGAAGPENAEDSARRACGVIQRMADQTARADARIAELDRECTQWRDELRIYRETESKRIAELERSVTVRDAEIARLETDLELARRDVDHLRLFARIRFGYAPGDYFGIPSGQWRWGVIHYRHNKTGNRYRLLACGIDSTNARDGLPVVVYCPDDNEHTIYVRELREFEAKFTAIGLDGSGESGQ